jgi:hypothetical protein
MTDGHVEAIEFVFDGFAQAAAMQAIHRVLLIA